MSAVYSIIFLFFLLMYIIFTSLSPVLFSALTTYFAVSSAHTLYTVTLGATQVLDTYILIYLGAGYMFSELYGE